MKTKKRRIRVLPVILGILGALAALTLAAVLTLLLGDWGFAREVSPREKEARLLVVQTAESWLGSNEADGSHQAIIDLYNGHRPLAQGYEVQYDDDWCSTFASAVAIQCALTQYIPTECGCQRHIGRFDAMDSWVEADDYVPLPGDYIFYCWSDTGIGDCTGWANHVGIVVGKLGPFLKIIEGNKDDRVEYRIILLNGPCIRGYGVPAYPTDPAA